jgi:hypothetical protein
MGMKSMGFTQRRKDAKEDDENAGSGAFQPRTPCGLPFLLGTGRCQRQFFLASSQLGVSGIGIGPYRQLK